MEDKLKLLEMFYISIDNELEKWKIEKYAGYPRFTGPDIEMDDYLISKFVIGAEGTLKLQIYNYKVYKESITIKKYYFFAFSKSQRKYQKYVDILIDEYSKLEKEQKQKEIEEKQKYIEKQNNYLKKTLITLESKNKQNIRKEKLKRFY